MDVMRPIQHLLRGTYPGRLLIAQAVTSNWQFIGNPLGSICTIYPESGNLLPFLPPLLQDTITSHLGCCHNLLTDFPVPTLLPLSAFSIQQQEKSLGNTSQVMFFFCLNPAIAAHITLNESSDHYYSCHHSA